MPVNYESLQLATLGTVNPNIEAMFQKHVRNIVDDVMNRPAEKKERKLLLELTVAPIVVENENTGERECHEVWVNLRAKSKIPTFQTRNYQMKVTKGGLLFNKEIPEQLHQPSLIDQK